MKKMFIKPITFILLLASLFSILSFSAFGMEKGDTGSIESFSVQNISTDFTEDDNVKISSRFLELLFKRGEKKEEIRLCPSGEAFGIIINEDGVTVTKAPIDSPLSVGDRIIKIGKNECTECGQVYEAVKNSGGSPLKLTVVRDGKECEISVTPKYKDGEYALGISLRSQSAGIGTITFIDPKTNAFGGLGHSVSDSETGDPVSLKGGVASKVTLGACKKGESGKAGELSGVLGRKSIGTLTSNNECGVFGVLTESSANAEKAIPIAYRDEIKEGEAEIISTIKNGKTATYKILITDVDTSSTSSKSFKIKVTDPTLIALTGGIIRGMSGSPIIQNGKLVGAVTHVMVADPTEGYGIFIENMLSAANEGALPKVA